MTKRCPQCNRPFTPPDQARNQKYCGPACVEAKSRARVRHKATVRAKSDAQLVAEMDAYLQRNQCDAQRPVSSPIASLAAWS